MDFIIEFLSSLIPGWPTADKRNLRHALVILLLLLIAIVSYLIYLFYFNK